MKNLKTTKIYNKTSYTIYDPMGAQIAALSLIRLIDLTEALEKSDTLEYMNAIVEHKLEKENQVKKLENEIMNIWFNFMMPSMVSKYPVLYDLVNKTIALANIVKKNHSRIDAVELLNLVNEFAEVFWKLKNIDTKKVKALYLPTEEIVVPI